MRLWRKEWAVRFDMKAVERRRSGRFSQSLVARIGQRTGEGNLVVEREGSLDFLGPGGEAVHDTARVMGFGLEEIE